MGQYTINIGDAANDGLGESIRTGFEKVNAMFAELYGATKTATLTFDDIANVPVADVNSLANWNTFFDFPNYGRQFTAVSVVGNSVTLTGRSLSILKDSLFRKNIHLVSISDAGVFRYISDLAFANSGVITASFTDAIYASYIAFGSAMETYSVFETLNAPNITTAGHGCFQGCTGLTSTGNITTAGDGCFQNCTGLTSTGNVTTAGDYCFAGCTSLTSTGNVTTAGDYCFAGCTGLTSTGNITTAGHGCFQGCTGLTSTGNVTTAGDYCFAGCTGLETMVFANLTKLGNDAGNNGVFEGITGREVINLTVPASFMTCNEGNPDGDIQYLIDNNTLVNITQV